MLNEVADHLERLPPQSREEVNELIKSISQKYSLRTLPKYSEILQSLPEEKRSIMQKYLRVKPVRTASGIVAIGVMTRPFPCPHGTCTFCPGGVPFGTPQSYIGTEPATMRAIQNEFDPFRQISSRLRQLAISGHSVSKVELVIQGGTFLSLPYDYQEEFVKSCFEALIDRRCSSLDEAHTLAETAPVRNVGLTIETKPDFCKEQHIDLMLRYGGTRVEIGVQALDNEILKLANRGHTLQDTVKAFQVARDAGFKIVAHMMPGLPGSNPERDFSFFERLFEDSAFKPDMLKVYPTLIVHHTALNGLYKLGRYKPYDVETTVNLLADVKRIIPKWVRIMRIQREFGSSDIMAGVKNSNLRELVLEEVRRRGYSCGCIRCREVGLKQLKYGSPLKMENVKLLRQDYEASGGPEVFLSFEDVIEDALIGFLRLRVPSEMAHRPELIGKSSCIIRELHVYGQMIPLGARDSVAWQHRGYGSALMAEAERIAREEFAAEKILVISGVGTREYYRRLGYEREGPYMSKRL